MPVTNNEISKFLLSYTSELTTSRNISVEQYRKMRDGEHMNQQCYDLIPLQNAKRCPF